MPCRREGTGGLLRDGGEWQGPALEAAELCLELGRAGHAVPPRECHGDLDNSQGCPASPPWDGELITSRVTRTSVLEGFFVGRVSASPGSSLGPPPCPPVFQAPRTGALGEGEASAPSRREPAEGGSETARGVEGSPEGRKGRRRKGRGWQAGQSNCMFVSSPVSAHEGACGGGCNFASRSLCLLAEVSVCLSQGSVLSLAPAPHFMFWGARLWAHPAVLRADAADVAGPQLCLLPGEGEGAAICSPDNGC